MKENEQRWSLCKQNYKISNKPNATENQFYFIEFNNSHFMLLTYIFTMKLLAIKTSGDIFIFIFRLFVFRHIPQ